MMSPGVKVLVAGTDEAGRGPLAGAVYAAAVILNPERPVEGLRDSKKLSEKRRDILFDLIQKNALACSIACATVEEIDQLNILHASLLAMRRAVDGLELRPDRVLVDGNRLPQWDYPSEAIVGGDAKYEEISAASILAKVARDRTMKAYALEYPEYGFDKHKGYPTAAHLSALASLGACPIHRKSFAPVQNELFER